MLLHMWWLSIQTRRGARELEAMFSGVQYRHLQYAFIHMSA
jgi:hypothetical protein